MRNRAFVTVMSIMMAAFITLIFLLRNGPSTSKKMSHDRVKYLRDSLEMEYIKKQLESYPYDHSEIKDTTVIK
jgi:pyruvate dehydrogenase complex dehydrogenase (E1) component